MTAMDDPRDEHFITQGLWEWLKSEKEKPRQQRRDSDVADVEQILERDYPDAIPYFEAVDRGREEARKRRSVR